jgi:aminobenzoyl-glutamate utilization protein B
MNTAHAAALGTGTDVKIETMHGNHSILPNETLARVMHQSLSTVGGYTMTASERAFAEVLSQSFINQPSVLGLEEQVLPFRFTESKGSTDVGDVSFAVPTVGLRTATWVPGTPAHSWQAVAAGGTDIGNKGMMIAAKTLALTAMELIDNPKIISAAKEEFLQKRGLDFKYIPMLGNRKPALNYRN